MWSRVVRCNSSVSARAFLRSSVILMISFSNARGFRRAVPSQCGIAARSDVDDFVGIGVISDAVREQQIGGVEVVGGVNVPMRENRVVAAHRSTLPARASDTPGRVTHSRARLTTLASKPTSGDGIKLRSSRLSRKRSDQAKHGCPRQCVVSGHAHSVSQDIRIGDGVTFGGCQRLAWSSPPSSSRAAANPRWPVPTGPHRAGSRGWSSATGSKVTPRSSRTQRRPHTSPSRLPQPTIDLIVSVREKLASGHRSSGRRNSALQNLVAEVPPPLVAEMLGYSHQVTQRHAELAAQPWSRYVK